ncbi:MAG: PD-(D/E)XK nuclease family protein [Chloroflexota bacterium]
MVGRTHYERWHSAFFGWLLDANGSHLLSDYVLRRFLLLLLDEKCLKATGLSEKNLLNTLPILEFSDMQVSPNEDMPAETSVSGIGRFDIFLTAHYSDDVGNVGNLNIIFELKIDSRPNGKQSAKYADWLFTNHSNDCNFLIYVTPKLLQDSKSTVGDGRWYCLDYQLLNDKLLIPLLDHPKLNEKVKPFIIQYIKNLKTRYKGIKMAITNEEKRLALALYEKYSDVFDSIYDALMSTGAIDYSTSDLADSKGRVTGRLAVRVENKIFSNETVRLLFEDVFRFIVDNDYLVKIPLPWGFSKNRYVLTNENPATHPNGRPFFYPVSYKGYTLESHYARDRALKVLGDLCEKLEIEFEVIET